MTPIAVVGLGALYPGSTSVIGYWRDILEGRDRLTDVPRTHWLREDYFDPRPGTPDKVYAARGGFLSPIDFAPLDFGIPPNALPATDTAQLLALVVAKRLLEEATHGKYTSMDRSRMSVILGVASATELVTHMSGRLQRPVCEYAMRRAGLDASDIARVSKALDDCYVPWQENTFPGLLGNVIAGRIANRLDLGGTNAVVDAACAGSLAAVAMAVNDLALGHSDLVVTGGVDALNDIFMYTCFAQTGALSVSGDCRPFSDQADGTMLGEGVGMLALRRLDDAERDGDAIYAVIRGIGSSSDGRSTSIYAPAARGQAIALRRAYERAGYEPNTVGLVEAHGTGTVAGDAAEFEALRAVFEESQTPIGRCALGSVKSQIGHTKAAAGAAGMIKAILALHHRVLPPTLKVSQPNPKLSFDESPFYLNTEARPWIHTAPHPRRASVSALGFGGTNFHIALEEYAGPSERPPRLRAVPSELVVLAAKDRTALAAACREAAAACTDEGALVHLARRTQLAFDASAPTRVAILAEDERDARAKLLSAADAIARGGSFQGDDIAFGTGSLEGGVAFLFPGQGSQYVGMGNDLAMHVEWAHDLWDEALGERVFPRPAFDDATRAEQEKRLTATEWAQPAITATSLGILRLLERAGVKADAVAGHSLGEITAAVAAGLFDERTGLAIARRRGELMAAASETPGAMTAASADLATVMRAIEGIDIVVANHNAPRQVVLSGAVNEIARATSKLEAAGIAAHRLPVATAFHSPLVGAAVEPFRTFLAGVPTSSPRVPHYANATAAPFPVDPAAACDRLAEAIVSPVRFVEQIEAMHRAGIRIFVEVGPDSVLSRLTSRCLDGRPHIALATNTRHEHGVTSFWRTLGHLAAAGVAVNFAPLWDREKLVDDPATKPKGQFTVKICGANYGKPYPPAEPEAPEYVQGTRVQDTRMQNTHIHDTINAAIAAQMEFQRLMAESHTAFLRALEGTYATSPPTVPVPMPVPAPLPAPPCHPEAAPRPPAPTPAAEGPPQPIAAPPLNIGSTLLAIVAEKTGYPEEMIDLSMDMERDLGIDSIKRVEILSAMRQQLPNLPRTATAKMTATRTLAQILELMSGHADGDTKPPVAPVVPEPPRRTTIHLAPAPPLGFAVPGLFDRGAIVVTADGGGIAATLVEKLRARGINAVLAATHAMPDSVTGAIFLGGLTPVTDDPTAIHRDALAVARHCAPRFREHGGLFVTVQDTGGDFGLTGRSDARAWLAGLSALAKTARHEWPRATVKAIDLERGDRSDSALADALVSELLRGGPEVEIGLAADGTRVTLTDVPSSPSTEPRRPIADGAVFVVTGGARGVTAASLLELARVSRPRILILGRTPLSDEPAPFHNALDEAELKRIALSEAKRAGLSPTPKELGTEVARILAVREVRDTLTQLAATGATVRYEATDVRNSDAIRALLDDVRRAWGPIRGIVHGAGVLADGFIDATTDPEFERVFDTKVRGLRALLDATRTDPLEWLCLFSSIAARYGNAGQSAYAMANEVLNKVAAVEARRREGRCRVVAIGWGPWDGGMVTPALRRHFLDRGVTPLPLAQGARAFVDELGRAPSDPVEVVIGEAAEPPARASVEISVSAATHPQLASHRIQGKSVLPMVLVLEWFARLARTLSPRSASIQVRNLRVLRGVPLDAFDGEGDRFQLNARNAERGFDLELCDAAGALRYSATIEPASPRAAAGPLDVSEITATPWNRTNLYSPEVLFHGRDFQVIHSIDGISERGARATLARTADLGWPHEPWETDPAAIDGALQLALVCGLHTIGPSLPLRIGAVGYTGHAAEGPLRCSLLVRSQTPERIVCDIALAGADGTPCADLVDVEMYRVPSGTTEAAAE